MATMTLGEKIKYYRECRHMSQEELSLRSGISISAIRKYEKGLRFPKEAQIEKMAFVFNISPALLQDIKFSSIYDSLPYLYAILRDGNVEFCGETDENGYLKEDTVSIKFHNNILKMFLKAWADKDTEIRQILEASTKLLDTAAKEDMLRRAEQLDSEIYSLVDSLLGREC